SSWGSIVAARVRTRSCARSTRGGTMTKLPTFEHFDAGMAEGMLRARGGGLPDFLGVKFLEFTPGRLVATLPVRDELLTPFGTLHGGVMAGLVDHVLGCGLYPLMPRGQWAATTEVKLNYLAPVKQGATPRAESTLLSLGPRTPLLAAP